ncbi:unnamed protein product [Cunninghamella echinulata]
MAAFSLIVHKYDKQAIDGINKCLENDCPMTLEPLIFGCLHEFPLPSPEIIYYLHENYNNNPARCYMVTGWSILMNIKLKNLKYAKDHFELAKRNNIEMKPQQISLYIYVGKCYEIDFDSKNRNGIRIYRNKALEKWEPTLDNACCMALYLYNFDSTNYEDLCEY